MARIEQVLMLQIIADQLAEINDNLNSVLLEGIDKEVLEKITENQSEYVLTKIKVTNVGKQRLIAEPTTRLISLVASIEKTIAKFGIDIGEEVAQ